MISGELRASVAYPPAMNDQMEPGGSGQEWKWSYNRWIGIMYGPIPVGIIIAVIALIAYVAFAN